jgi:hypothetical protein
MAKISTMNKLYSLLIAATICGTASAQCLTISCNSNSTVNNDIGFCGAVVNYTTPTVTSYTCTGANQDTFDYTGAMQSFVVPVGVTSVNIQTWGAQGGSNWVNNNNFGGYVAADVAVTPGSTLYIYVGGQATTTVGGFNGGGSGEGAGKGGGGGTDVRIGGTTYNDRVVVAGGGGGAGYWSSLHVVGGAGGGLTGGDGYRDPSFAANPGGRGATQLAGGADGTCATFNVVACAGGFGYGGSITGCGCEVYGGGGGWYGGAASGNCRGGGGGSGYAIPAATNVVMNTGVRTGNGRVIIGYTGGTPAVTQTAGLPSGSLFPIGTTTNTFTSTDGINTATCSFDITVVDIENPILAGLPSAITQANDAAQCGANISWTAITATDNCSATVTTNPTSGSFFPVGTTVVSVMAMDPSGNMDTASFTVTVNDTEPPVITNTNGNTTISSDPGMCSALIFWAPPSVSDNCGASLTSNYTNGTAFPLGTSTVVFTANDSAGNTDTVSFTITVVDTAMPVVQCPSDVTVSADSGMCSASNVSLGSVTVMDNCSTTVSNDAPSVFPIGTTLVTHTITDAGGNMITCTQSVIVTDDEAPSFTDCPQDIGTCPGVVVFPSPNASDNCGASVSQLSGPTSGSTLSPGLYAVAFVAMDTSGNTDTCTFNISVYPNPNVTTSNPTTVCVTDGNLMLSGSPAGGTWSGTAVTGNSFSPSTAGNGQHVLTYLYTDSSGCSASGIDTITVSPCVGISEQGAVTFSLFPNPANTTFTFNCEAQGTLVLIDALGKVVLTKSIVDSQTQIGIEGLATGAYIVRFTSTSGIISTSQLQVQR